MSFKKVVDHCIKHNFLSPSFNRLSFLGEIVEEKVKHEWKTNSVIQNDNCLFTSTSFSPSVNVDLVQLFVKTKVLMGSETSTSLAGLISSKEITAASEPKTLSDLLATLPETHLNLCTLIQPGSKIDEFTKFQKRRRRWWKSYLQQPELFNSNSASSEDVQVEQKIEFTSPAVDSEVLEVITLHKPEAFDQLQLDEDTKKSLMVKYQRKLVWPHLVTSQVRLELALWLFFIDAYFTRNKSSVLSLHKSLAPYGVGIIVDGTPTKTTELQDLRRFMSLDFKQSRISVLPLSAGWTINQCDARGVPYLIVLSDSTLEQGICGLRSRDTSLQEQVHVSDVVERLKKFLVQ